MLCFCWILFSNDESISLSAERERSGPISISDSLSLSNVSKAVILCIFCERVLREFIVLFGNSNVDNIFFCISPKDFNS